MEPQAPIRQKIIREIKPSPVLQARTRNHRLRVAAYCRVSTEQEEQQTSIENQITYYDDLIRSNPEWEYAGVFSDDGISGTRDENRPGFMEMIKQCKKGKIDMILAKSLSRFSRNTLQCISYIRMLKDRGIIIRFEKEGLDTSRVTSEIFFNAMKRSAVGKAASAIPGIGNAVTAVTELVLTSAVMVRNSFGAVIVILLLLIGAGPIIHYGSLSLVYRFLAAIAQPISDKRVVGALSTMGEGCAMLLKLLLTAEVLCMLTFLIVVVSVS